MRPGAVEHPNERRLEMVYHGCEPARYASDMKSLRLDPALEKRLQRAAAVAGQSLSEFIRQAAAERADTLLETTDREDFADVLGLVHGGGGQARHTGAAFAEALDKSEDSV